MVANDRKLEQALLPVAGQSISWKCVGFQADEIVEWHWFQEEWDGPQGTWAKIPCDDDFLELTDQMLGLRLMARVRLRSGAYVAGVTWPVIGVSELDAFRFEAIRQKRHDSIQETKDMKKVRNSIRLERELLQSTKSYQDLVKRNEELLSERRKENKAIRDERQKIWEANSVGEVLKEIQRKQAAIDKRESDLKSAESRLKAARLAHQAKEGNLKQLTEQNRKRELDFRDELLRNFEEKKSALKDLEARLLGEQQAFLADQDLQRRLQLVNAQLLEAETLWDVLAKANNLKLKLSTSAKAEIIRMISNEVESQKAASRAAVRSTHSVFDSVSMCGSCGNIINACGCS